MFFYPAIYTQRYAQCTCHLNSILPTHICVIIFFFRATRTQNMKQKTITRGNREPYNFFFLHFLLLLLLILFSVALSAVNKLELHKNVHLPHILYILYSETQLSFILWQCAWSSHTQCSKIDAFIIFCFVSVAFFYVVVCGLKQHHAFILYYNFFFLLCLSWWNNYLILK